MSHNNKFKFLLIVTSNIFISFISLLNSSQGSNTSSTTFTLNAILELHEKVKNQSIKVFTLTKDFPLIDEMQVQYCQMMNLLKEKREKLIRFNPESEMNEKFDKALCNLRYCLKYGEFWQSIGASNILDESWKDMILNYSREAEFAMWACINRSKIANESLQARLQATAMILMNKVGMKMRHDINSFKESFL